MVKRGFDLRNIVPVWTIQKNDFPCICVVGIVLSLPFTYREYRKESPANTPLGNTLIPFDDKSLSKNDEKLTNFYIVALNNVINVSDAAFDIISTKLVIAHVLKVISLIFCWSYLGPSKKTINSCHKVNFLKKKNVLIDLKIWRLEEWIFRKNNDLL